MQEITRCKHRHTGLVPESRWLEFLDGCLERRWKSREADYGDRGFPFGPWSMRESYQGVLSRANERASALCWEGSLLEGMGVKTVGRAAVGGSRGERVPAESENGSPPYRGCGYEESEQGSLRHMEQE